MKKVLSVLSLIAILGITTPVFAGPPGGPHGGPRGFHGGHGPHGGGHRIHAGGHHRPHMGPRHHHGGVVVHSSHRPRHSCWYGYRTGYWGYPWCDHRLGWCDPYYYPYGTHAGVHFPLGNTGVSISF